MPLPDRTEKQPHVDANRLLGDILSIEHPRLAQFTIVATIPTQIPAELKYFRTHTAGMLGNTRVDKVSCFSPGKIMLCDPRPHWGQWNINRALVTLTARWDDRHRANNGRQLLPPRPKKLSQLRRAEHGRSVGLDEVKRRGCKNRKTLIGRATGLVCLVHHRDILTPTVGAPLLRRRSCCPMPRFGQESSELARPTRPHSHKSAIVRRFRHSLGNSAGTRPERQ